MDWFLWGISVMKELNVKFEYLSDSWRFILFTNMLPRFSIAVPLTGFPNMIFAMGITIWKITSFGM